MTTKRKRDKRGSRSRTAAVKREDQQAVSTPDEDTPPPRKPNTFKIDIAHPLFRLYAYLTDIFILYVIIIVTKQIFGDNIWYPEAAPQDIGIILGYFVIPTALWGRTPGKWLTGLVVVDKEGYTAGLAAIPREIFGRAIAIAFLLVGIIWAYFDSKHQGWHDKIAGTYVVYHPRSGIVNWLRRAARKRDSAKLKHQNKV